MVEPVEVSCRIMASSLVPDVKTSFQLLPQLWASNISGIQLYSSLACGSEHFMHGRCRGLGIVRFPGLYIVQVRGNPTRVGTTESD